METGSSLQCAQVPTTGQYPEPDESTVQAPILFI
jgi:hypothetical protein